MAGFIDTSTDDQLWRSYNGGRLNVGKQSTKVSDLAQWSALLDDGTCDFCSWADERIFDTSIEPYDPPMHHGCRCLIALILKSEFPPPPTWGKGPPPRAFPPGNISKSSTTVRSPAGTVVREREYVLNTRKRAIAEDMGRVRADLQKGKLLRVERISDGKDIGKYRAVIEVKFKSRTVTSAKPPVTEVQPVKPAPKPRKRTVKKIDNSNRLVGTSFEVDELTSAKQVESWLLEKGIKADLTGMNPRTARDTGRAIEKWLNAYPDMRFALNKIGTQGGAQALDISSALAAEISSGSASAAVEISTGTIGVGTDMVVQARALKVLTTRLRNGFVTNGGHEGMVWHELGHVTENYVSGGGLSTSRWLREVVATVYDGDTLLLAKDMSKYSLENGHELFGEMFHIANRAGGIGRWNPDGAVQGRLRQVMTYFQEEGLPIAETQL